MRKIFITGTGGFIGFHLVQALVSSDFEIVGIDSLNAYYSIKLKIDRLSEHGIVIEETNKLGVKPIQSIKYINYKFYHVALEDTEMMTKIFDNEKPSVVVNLAAQAGVRYSLTNPREYIKSNIDGFLNILEGCRKHPVSHLIYASSSSVYGMNTETPFKTTDAVDHPISLYAATKKSNELMAHTYAYLFGIPSTGLRFFTVYGPWGRPDMALFLFTKAILNNEPIQLFNNGNMVRDFTYITDIVQSIKRLIDKPPINSDNYTLLQHPDSSIVPYRVLNIGNNMPILLKDFISALEKVIGKKAVIENRPMQPGDVKITHADVKALERITGYVPSTSLNEGIGEFVKWYRDYFKV